MSRLGWVITAMLLGTSLSLAETGSVAGVPARLAIFYGYPSLVNGARGDVEKAAAVFSAYDVIVLGDGLEFADSHPGRKPVGDPAEHQKTVQIIAAARRRNPAVRFYGYVPLGDNHSLTPPQIEERIRLWKQMDVAGIFLDEASYDFKIVTRERQNNAVRYAHQLGLSVFMNGYFLDHLFSVEDKLPNENGTGKNPKRLPPLLDHRDLFLMESFQVSNGTYEDPAHWQARMKQAVAYRRRYGTRIFAVTTTTGQQGFDAQKFNYAWWSAWLYDVDGFGWGEPNFSAADNLLPERRCRSSVRGSAAAASADSAHVWRKANGNLLVLDTKTHAVKRVAFPGASPTASDVNKALLSAQGSSVLSCEAAR